VQYPRMNFWSFRALLAIFALLCQVACAQHLKWMFRAKSGYAPYVVFPNERNAVTQLNLTPFDDPNRPRQNPETPLTDNDDATAVTAVIAMTAMTAPIPAGTIRPSRLSSFRVPSQAPTA